MKLYYYPYLIDEYFWSVTAVAIANSREEADKLILAYCKKRIVETGGLEHAKHTYIEAERALKSGCPTEIELDKPFALIDEAFR